ncbi:uncharacterized protein BCR38DRAFT_337119, partial [Pseudomassariella vexata]
YAHGITHGDIKPANFLRAQNGTLRLCDFDVALRVDEDRGSGSLKHATDVWRRNYPEERTQTTNIRERHACSDHPHLKALYR